MSIATTYAEALYEAARDGGVVGDVATQLGELRQAVRDVPELSRLLGDPDVDTPTKKRTLGALTEGATPLVVNFVQVLLDRGRADLIEPIGREFEARVAHEEGRLRVVVRTAIPMPDDLRRDVIGRLERNAGGPIDVEAVVDPAIVGGVVIQTETARVDASVRQRLDSMRQSMGRASVHDAVAAD